MSMHTLDQFHKRPYISEDKAALYQICLQTADAGRDASCIYKDASLIGDLYVGPYLNFEPELACVMEDFLGVCGYLVAVKDTIQYQEWFFREWLPKIQSGREAPKLNDVDGGADASLLASLFDFSMYQPDWLADFPAHFHIEFLERAQRKGQGKKWMTDLFGVLKHQGCPGVHLGMHPDNQHALSFFQQLGFSRIEHVDLPWEEVLYLGKDLKP